MKKNYESIVRFGVFRRNFIGTRVSSPAKNKAVTVFLLSSIVLGFMLFAGFIDASFFSGISSHSSILTLITPIRKPESLSFPLTCARANETTDQNRCSNINYPTFLGGSDQNRTCPSYFRWIHEDLKRWKHTGVTKEMVETAKRSAHFRVLIVDGKAYVEKFRKSLQTRDLFSIWGILQLVRYYPGRLPDLELMFDCDDRPVVKEKNFRRPEARPPPVFRYCSDPWSLDIVFPDWSFWGWAECNIKPWGEVLEEIREGNKRIKWEDRKPFAYWRGNPNVAPTRRDLLKCNVSDKDDWNTRLYVQNWDDQKKQGYKESNLGDQCTHRYKIYTEGWAWSVSEKYILACDSMTLYIKSRYHDFYIRAMEPLKHYWPIQQNSKCTSLKYAVDWGNNNTQKAKEIGEAASRFMQEDMKMENIYNYMFHLLNEYGKLFKYKPIVPAEAFELCPESMACHEKGTVRHFMEDSLVKFPSETAPCHLPPHYSKPVSQLLERKASSTRQVEAWEHEYWRTRLHNH